MSSRKLATVLAATAVVVLAACGSSSTKSGSSSTTAAPAASTAATTATTVAPAGPIFTQTGSGTATTASFKVPNQWNFTWSYDCTASSIGTGNFITANYDLTGSLGGNASSGGSLDIDNQGVNQVGPKGAGVEHYHSGGNTKYVKVISECPWTITVTKA